MSLPLPDEPRWVEAHGIAADTAGWRRDLGAGFVVGHDRARLVVASEHADASALATLASELSSHAVLMMTEPQVAALRAAGRAVDRALLHTLSEPDALPDCEGAMPLDAATLAHASLPAELADELDFALARGDTVWTALVDGAPVSFAHAPWRSARWFDISVETLPGARQLGLATIVAGTMIRHERARGCEPVWGADEANHASLALARRLGFVAVDALWVAAPISGARS